MACKIPVIGSDAGAIAEVIGNAGIIFKQQDCDSLTHSLRILMADEHMREFFGYKGYERVKMYYSHEAIAHQTVAFFKNIVGENHD